MYAILSCLLPFVLVRDLENASPPQQNRHLDRLSDLGDIPTEVFIDLLKRAKEKATPDLVKRFQDINEVLRLE